MSYFYSAAVAVTFILLSLIWIQGSISENENQWQPHGNQRPQRKLLLISFDGFRWNYLNGRAETPNFNAAIKHGIHATKGLQNAFLSNTLPNHFTLVTGLHVESHGFVDNFMYDPLTDDVFIPKFYDKNSVNHPDWHNTVGEPIWVTNQLQNEQARSGVIMWMGGETVIKGIRPSRHLAHDDDVPDIEKVDTFINWLNDEKEPINLGVVYFHQPDIDGHKYGPDSKEITQQIEKLDNVVGYIFEQLEKYNLKETTDVIFTSDHGFVSVGKDKLINLDEIIDPDTYRHASHVPGPIASIIPNEGMTEQIYQKMKTESDNSGLFTVYKKSDIPERFHYKNHRRVTPIFAMASTGYTFVHNRSSEDFVLAGNHGYDNELPEMRPFFIAKGPSFKEGFSVETFPNVDLYGLMCHILQLKPAPNNGSMETVSQFLRDKPGPMGYQFSFWQGAAFIIAVVSIVGLISSVMKREKTKRS